MNKIVCIVIYTCLLAAIVFASHLPRALDVRYKDLKITQLFTQSLLMQVSPLFPTHPYYFALDSETGNYKYTADIPFCESPIPIHIAQSLYKFGNIGFTMCPLNLHEYFKIGNDGDSIEFCEWSVVGLNWHEVNDILQIDRW